MMSSRFKLLLLTLFLSLGINETALAHKVNLFAYVEGGTVFTESYFPDGRPISEGRVEVYNTAEKLLATGQTDTAGLWNFPIPGLVDLKIVIDAGMGHKNSYRLEKEELEAGQ